MHSGLKQSLQLKAALHLHPHRIQLRHRTLLKATLLLQPHRLPPRQKALLKVTLHPSLHRPLLKKGIPKRLIRMRGQKYKKRKSRSSTYL